MTYSVWVRSRSESCIVFVNRYKSYNRKRKISNRSSDCRVVQLVIGGSKDWETIICFRSL
ncbi:MAG: hypothetical protein EAZ19_29460 [Oscillatoriales cyanobacterium]|nr:MAG: hypothetical protein EAZ88_14790 [Oscillatoriales cyanobacterium]TAE69952.1 MAG: hypothetical protein EAZ86_08110 [Oscillatoriales cyanobacterium]TAF89234.1 MAG: hypothetical protein EAZ49_13395 [Oscillatoriales cyanobacterium]TAF98456.1 MAG: hypothetical protein EAZ45_20365 [Oscillatoriales cyanobacterium]TAG53648.1 MAG: hypothetical protein EAZ28_26905 [Oscillatoriales cyanobacterium]